MSQRASGYLRKVDEAYTTTPWPIVALLPHVRMPIVRTWDPCDRDKVPGTDHGRLVATLRACGIVAIGTTQDFLTVWSPPPDTSHLITNPPYGARKRGEEAVAFIEHALELRVPYVAMLLRVDFDSAVTRQHLFRHCPVFAGKVVLLNRIKWFQGPSSPSDNHSWFLWDREHAGPPLIRYASKREAEESLIIARRGAWYASHSPQT
jgi:hypothetical protein